MDDRLDRLEAVVTALGRRVGELEQRLHALETERERATVQGPVPQRAALHPEGPTAGAIAGRPLDALALDATAWLSVAGRTLLVLAGAFLLRALTEAGTLHPPLGVALGMGYALTWLVAADRAGTKGRTLSAAFHGIAAVLIALPLLLEAQARFALLRPVAAAAGLAGFAAFALGIAARHRLRALAWITTLGVLAAAIAFVAVTGRLAPFGLVVVLLGGATLWFGYVLDWFMVRWPAAIAADALVLALGLRSVTEGVADTPAAALVVQIVFLAIYLGSVATRTLFLNRSVVPFEIFQSVAVIAIGLGGAAHVTHASGIGAAPVGAAALVLAAGCYAVALAFVERRQGRRKNFYFYTSAALVFALVGSGLLLAPRTRTWAWAAMGLAALLAGRGSGRMTFHVHGTVYALAAAALSGLFGPVAHALALRIGAARELDATMVAVLAVCAGGVVLLAPSRRWQPATSLQRLPRCVLLIVTVGGILGGMADAVAPSLVAHAGPAVGPGAVATLRTALLVVATLVLAWAGARGFVEAAWLVYPLLVLTGLKFVFHDLRTSRPVTLFLGFALYGAALLVGPRLRRRARKATAPLETE
jgi:hypothetical protein